MRYVLENPSKEFGVRKLSRRLGLSPGHTSRVLKTLSEYDIIVESKVDLGNPFTRILKVLFNIQKLREIDCVERAKSFINGLKGIGVYGSWANGTNYEESDLDIWIKAKKAIKERDVAMLNSYLLKNLDVEVSILTLWPEKIEKLKEDKVFYHSLVFGSIILWGEGIGQS